MNLQTTITLLPFLFLSSIATTGGNPATLGRRGLSTNCNPVFEACGGGGGGLWPWPFSPITSTNHFVSRHPSPPSLFPSPPYVVVPSPPPVFTDDHNSNPSIEPLIASPPPPGEAFRRVFPELPPAFSPPAGGANLSPEVILPPIAGGSPPAGVFMSPPQQKYWPPPVVPIDVGSQVPEAAGEFPPYTVMRPPPVGEKGRSETQLPPIVKAPPAP